MVEAQNCVAIPFISYEANSGFKISQQAKDFLNNLPSK
jgi:hypothetical protein